VITRRLGGTSLQASVLGLGGNTFGPPRLDAEQSTLVIHAALDRGVRLIDTAAVYGQGHSESFIGKALQGRRDEVLIATKFNFLDLDGDPAARVRAHCEQSLRRLDTDRIDLLQVHLPTDVIGTDELLRTLSELRDAGKIRAYGSSNYASWRVAESALRAEALGVPGFATAQNHYSLLHRRPEQELVRACERYGVSLIPYHPLSGGYLTGKYRPGQPPPPGTRGAAGSVIVDRMSTDRNWQVVQRLTDFAEQRGHTVGELAVAWLVAQPVVGTVITGISTVEQLEQNVRGAQWALTPDEVAEVAAITDGPDNEPSEGYAGPAAGPHARATR
jgi:aryl-alcohol dehydrogenase-like predicted oxidoreductase